MLKYCERLTFSVPSVLWRTVSLPLYLLKHMNWDDRSMRRGMVYGWKCYFELGMWERGQCNEGMGGKPIPGRDGT